MLMMVIQQETSLVEKPQEDAMEIVSLEVDEHIDGDLVLWHFGRSKSSKKLHLPTVIPPRMGILMQTNGNGSGNVTRVRKHAVEALHVAAEDHLLGWFQDCLLGQIHRGKQSLQKVDAEFINILRRDHADRWRVQGSRFSK